MPKVQHYSISRKLTLVNMLVSVVALLLASGGFCAYDLYSFPTALVPTHSTPAPIIQHHTPPSPLVAMVVGLAITGFMGSLYSKLETGNRFINLSVDMFCIAGFDGFFKSLNPSFERTLGFTAEELLAKPYLEFIHRDDRQATTAQAHQVKNHEIIAFENRYLCKDGSYKWLLWNAVSVPEQEVIYAVARDITKRKRDEAEKRKFAERLAASNQELELRNREVEPATHLKSKFLAILSHESP